MVFLIQPIQNRGSKATHLELDQPIRSVSGARNRLMDREALADEDLQEFQEEFEKFRQRSEQTAEVLQNIGGKTASR